MSVDFRIWGRIEQIMGGGFLAIASTVREDLDPSGSHVLSQMYATREAAELALREFMNKLGQDIRKRGGRIADVETDGM